MTKQTMRTTKGTALALMLSLLIVSPAKAQSHDYFSHMTPAQQPQQKTEEHPILGAMALESPRTPIVSWFESFDTTVFTLKASDADRVTLNQPFEKSAQRVQQWIDTAHRVAQNYRLLATTIKRMPVPTSAPDLQKYRNLKADWYSDVAAIYEDLITPHRPPKTQEELDGQLDEIKQRAVSLAEERQKLKEMDLNLRKAYMVHASRETDPLSNYVRGR